MVLWVDTMALGAQALCFGAMLAAVVAEHLAVDALRLCVRDGPAHTAATARTLSLRNGSPLSYFLVFTGCCHTLPIQTLQQAAQEPHTLPCFLLFYRVLCTQALMCAYVAVQTLQYSEWRSSNKTFMQLLGGWGVQVVVVAAALHTYLVFMPVTLGLRTLTDTMAGNDTLRRHAVTPRMLGHAC